MPDETVVLDVDGQEVRVTHPDKVFFSKRGETKLDLVEYYLAVRDPLLDAMGGRPVLLERYPDGAGGKSFFQKRIPSSAPEWLRTMTVATPAGTTSNVMVVADMAHVVWAVNQGCLGFHVWPNKAIDPGHADQLRIDLDPQPGTNFDEVREAAEVVRRVLDDVGLVGFPKTSGSKGIHIYVHLQSRWTGLQVRNAAVALAREAERRQPDLITAEWWKELRGERIFVDYNQNAPHKTMFGAWSARPRVGAQVSTPIDWDEIGTVAPEELTIASVPARLGDRGNPWDGISDRLQSLDRLLGWHERDVSAGLLDAPWPPQYPKQPNEPTRVAPSRARKS